MGWAGEERIESSPEGRTSDVVHYTTGPGDPLTVTPAGGIVPAMHPDTLRSGRSVALILGGVAGGLVAVALTVGFLYAVWPRELAVTSGCSAPCPTTTIEYGEDWIAGSRWTITTVVDEDGTTLSSDRRPSPIAAGYADRSVLLAPGVAGAACGVAAGWLTIVLRSRRARTTRPVSRPRFDPGNPAG